MKVSGIVLPRSRPVKKVQLLSGGRVADGFVKLVLVQAIVRHDRFLLFSHINPRAYSIRRDAATLDDRTAERDVRRNENWPGTLRRARRTRQRKEAFYATLVDVNALQRLREYFPKRIPDSWIRTS